MDRKFQNKLQDLLNNYETNIKQAIKQNKIPELVTLQAAINNLKFILENYKNKNVSEGTLMLKKINLLDSVDFSKLSYFVSPSSKPTFDELYKQTHELLNSGDLAPIFGNLNNNSKEIEQKITEIKRKNESNRQKERKLRTSKRSENKNKTEAEIIDTIERERQAKAGTLKSISTTDTFSKLMTGFINLSYFDSPELKTSWRGMSENIDPYTYLKTYTENVQNALHRLIQSKSLLDKESLQNEFSAISSYIANDDNKKSVSDLISIHSSLEKLKSQNKSLNKISAADAENNDPLNNSRDETENINIAIKKILNDLEEQLEIEGNEILTRVAGAKTDHGLDNQLINKHIAQINMPVLTNTYIPSNNVLKRNFFNRNSYSNVSSRVSRESILVNDKLNQDITLAQSADITEKGAVLTSVGNIAEINSSNLLNLTDQISIKSYKNLDKNDKAYYDRSLEQLTQQILSNMNLIRSFELLGENPEVVDHVKQLNRELVERKQKLERAKNTNNDESIGNKILSYLKGPWGFLNSVAAMLGLGGIFSLYKLLKDVPEQQKQLGQIRYNVARNQVQSGADINPAYGRTFTEMGRYYHHISGMNISKEAPAKFFGALTNSIGGRYGQNPNQNQRDMFEFSTNLFAIKEAHGLDDSSFNPLIKTLYKDSNYDVETTSRLIATTIANAKSSNVPVKAYLQQVGGMVSSVYELSMSAEDAMDITAHFTNKGYLIEDVTSFVKHSAQIRADFGKNASQTAYFGGMAGFGGDMFANMMLGRISVDRFGNNIEDFQRNMGKIMLTKYSMYEDFLGGSGDSNLTLAYFGKMLKEDGYNDKEVSMAMSMKKEGKIEDLEKFLGGKNDRELKKKEDLANAIAGANVAIEANGSQLSEIQKILADRKDATLQLAQAWEDAFGPLYDMLGKLIEGFLRAAADIIMQIYDFLMNLYDSKFVQKGLSWAQENPKTSIAGAIATAGVAGAGVQLARSAIKSQFLGNNHAPRRLLNANTIKSLAKGGGKIALGAAAVGGLISFMTSSAETSSIKNENIEDKIIDQSNQIGKSSQDVIKMSESGNAHIKLMAPGEQLIEYEQDNEEIEDVQSFAGNLLFGGILTYKLLNPMYQAYKQAKLNIAQQKINAKAIRRHNAKLTRPPKPPKPPKMSRIGRFTHRITSNIANKKQGLKTQFKYNVDTKIKTFQEFRSVYNANAQEAAKLSNVVKEVKGGTKFIGAFSFATAGISEYADYEMGNIRSDEERLMRVLIRGGLETTGAVVGGIAGGVLTAPAAGVGSFAGMMVGSYAGSKTADWVLEKLGMGEKLSEGTRQWAYSLTENSDMFGKNIEELIKSETKLGQDLRQFLKENGIDVENMTDIQNKIMSEMLDRFSKEHMTLAQLMNQIVLNNTQGLGINNQNNPKIEEMMNDNTQLGKFFEYMSEQEDNPQYKQVYTHIANYYYHPNAGSDDKEYWENEAYQLKEEGQKNLSELGKRVRNNYKDYLMQTGKWQIYEQRAKAMSSTSSYADSDDTEVSDDLIFEYAFEDFNADAATETMARLAKNAKDSPETFSAFQSWAKSQLDSQNHFDVSKTQLDRNIMEHNWNWDPKYTDHEKLRPEAIEMTNAVALAYMQSHGGEKITLTGAAEKIGSDGRPVHQPGEYSHHSGWKVDIVANDMEWVAKWLREHGYAAGIEDAGSRNAHVDANASGYDSRANFKPTTKPRGGSGGPPPSTPTTPTQSNSGFETAAAKLGVGLGKLRTAQIISQRTGIPVEYILAQMIKESGWTDDEAGGAYHNYGGLKAGDIGYGLWGKRSKDHTIFASDEQYADYWVRKVIAINDPQYKSRLLAAAAKNDVAEYVHVMKEAGYFTTTEESYRKSMVNIVQTLQKHGITGVAAGIPLIGGGYTPKPPKTFQQEMADANALMKKLAFSSYTGRLIDGVFVDKNQKPESLEERKAKASKINYNVNTYYQQIAEEQSAIKLSEDILEHQQLLSKEQEELKEIQKQKAEADKKNIALIIIKGFMKEKMSSDDMLQEIYSTLKTHKWTKDISMIEDTGVELGGAKA